MSTENNDGRSQDSGLVRRKIWLGRPFALNQIEIFDLAGKPPEPEGTSKEQAIGISTDYVPPVAEVVLLGEEPRTFEG